jgi:RNA polymerase sigma factor (sigma-70 family)
MDKEKLYEDHIGYAIKFAFYLNLGIRDLDEDDIKQEVRYVVLEAANTYDPKRGSFTTYVLSAVRMHLYDLLKKALRESRRSQTESVSIEPFYSLPDSQAQPDEVVFQREELRSIVKKSKKMTALERKALFGTAFGYSYKELGGDFKTLDNAVQRARRKLAA